MNSNHIDTFIKTRISNHPDEIYENLLKLSPVKLSDNKLLDIINWVESERKQLNFMLPHYNIFGTGGDFSINISTMAAILASNFVTIKKVGTSAVNSKFGASDFYSYLIDYLSEIPIDIAKKMSFKKDSEYISLTSLGFKYNEALKIARKRLKRNNELDIYKIVFPIANYTNPRGQVNGVCNQEYLEIYKRLSIKLLRNSWIVLSEYGYDEALPGRNRLVRVKDGKAEESELIIPKSTFAPDELTSERSSVREHVQIFEKIVTGDSEPDLFETVIYNSALILTLAQEQTDIHEMAFKIKKQLYGENFIHNKEQQNS